MSERYSPCANLFWTPDKLASLGARRAQIPTLEWCIATQCALAAHALWSFLSSLNLLRRITSPLEARVDWKTEALRGASPHNVHLLRTTRPGRQRPKPYSMSVVCRGMAFHTMRAKLSF